MLSAHIHTWRQINRGPNTQSVSSHTHMHTRNTHTHPHTDAVTLPPAQPVYIISSVWFCSLLNSMGIWDIFFSLPPSHSLTLFLSHSLLPFTPFSSPPPTPLSSLPPCLSSSSLFCLPVFPPSQALSLTPDFLSRLSSSIHVSCHLLFVSPSLTLVALLKQSLFSTFNNL